MYLSIRLKQDPDPLNETTGVAVDAADALFNITNYHVRDILVAGLVEVVWSKYHWYCEGTACDRLSFFEPTTQIPTLARSTTRLWDHRWLDIALGAGYWTAPSLKLGNVTAT